MNWFLIFNNSYSGIVQGQAIDRLKAIEAKHGGHFKLVVFVSWRILKKERQAYKTAYADSLVLPIIFGLSRWELNLFQLIGLSFLKKPSLVVGRGAFATALAIRLRERGRAGKVVYDGRGAEREEWREYLSRQNPSFNIDTVEKAEAMSVLKSDFQFAVSKALVQYWREQYGYAADTHMVIPCTVNSFFLEDVTVETKTKAKLGLGYSAEDILLLFSGSKSDWHSFEMAEPYLERFMQANENLKLMVLSKLRLSNAFNEKFSDRVRYDWVRPSEVRQYYLASDYGLLIREHSITNKVASPVKFAEYICSGVQPLYNDSIEQVFEFCSKKEIGVNLDGIDGSNIYWNVIYSKDLKKMIGASKAIYSFEPYLTKWHLHLWATPIR